MSNPGCGLANTGSSYLRIGESSTATLDEGERQTSPSVDDAAWCKWIAAMDMVGVTVELSLRGDLAHILCILAYYSTLFIQYDFAFHGYSLDEYA